MIPYNKHDFGCLRFTKLKTYSNGYHIELVLQYRYDNDYNFIEIYTKWHEVNRVVHVYYSNEYTRRNLEEAKRFYDLLLKSYRSKELSLSKKVY